MQQKFVFDQEQWYSSILHAPQKKQLEITTSYHTVATWKERKKYNKREKKEKMIKPTGHNVGDALENIIYFCIPWNLQQISKTIRVCVQIERMRYKNIRLINAQYVSKNIFHINLCVSFFSAWTNWTVSVFRTVQKV